uniref:ATP synthase complex subunit 8 n=1 Tax=Curculionoidea sp. 1 KM-2017 TaxID=2219392 RepID=A0A346RI06_9CUCU|nr:ATP synthase F0 subunit 8 [Curculionoidea sp. 1 KM-2017]
MPQMSPMNWTSLFIAFSLLLILFMIMNYFNFKLNTNSNNNTLNNFFKNNWKW